MARRGDSVIGIDLGQRVLKAVSLRRKSDHRLILTSFTSREIPENLNGVDDLAQHVKQLVRDLGGSVKGCAVAISDPTSILRIIEQPNTPVDLLRTALRLNGLAVLNQECKDFVLDVAPVTGHTPELATRTDGGEDSSNIAVQAPVTTKTKYLVGGTLRSLIKTVCDAMNKVRLP